MVVVELGFYHGQKNIARKALISIIILSSLDDIITKLNFSLKKSIASTRVLNLAHIHDGAYNFIRYPQKLHYLRSPNFHCKSTILG